MNPRLYQAMDLLYMPLLDLQQHLKQELLTNPFLELQEPGDEEEGDTEGQENTEGEGEVTATATEEAPAEERVADGETDWEEILLDGFDTAGGMREQSDERQ